MVIDCYLYLALWLITEHLPEYRTTNCAFNPLLIPEQAIQTRPMVLVRTAQYIDIFVIRLGNLLLNVLHGELLNADWAFLFLHFGFGEHELDRREEVG